MEFNLDFLKNTGNALKNIDYSNTDVEDKEERSTAESVKPIVLDKTDDENTIDESTTEVIQTETKDKKKESEDDLEKKLKNIEKVIETFSGSGGTTTIENKGKLPAAVNLNQTPLDMGTTQAKAYQAEYLKPSNVQDERIALLYQDLKKYNLI
jgi:hypothetical protein